VTRPLSHDVHDMSEIRNDAPVTVPVPRAPGVDWPGDGEVAFVPAALMLAARGRCSCPSCVDGFVHMLRRSRLQAV
jgi:hypothetical protein